VHDQLLSLRRLFLQGRRVAFTRAFLSWRRQGLISSWTGTVRGGPFDELSFAEDDVALSGETLDGRTFEGRAVVRRPPGYLTTLEIEGSGPLLVEDREI